MPEFMQEWWFLGLMAGLLCLFVLVGLIVFIVVMVIASNRRRRDEELRD
jgi:hypothetical protein